MPGDLEYTPVNPAPMVGEFNNLGRNGYINEQQMRQMQQGGGSKVKQRQHEDVNTNISPTDNFGGPHHPRNHFEPPPQQQQQPLPPQAQAPQRGVVYHNQQQLPLVGVVQQEYTSVNRAGAAGPQPGNISWSHMRRNPVSHIISTCNHYHHLNNISIKCNKEGCHNNNSSSSSNNNNNRAYRRRKRK